MLPKLTQVQDTYQGQTVTVTKVEVDGEATLRLKDGLITDGTYIYRMIARADQAREIVVSIGNISVSYSLSAVYETFSQSYMSVVADSHPCVTIIFPTGTYYLYQVELDGNSVSSDLLEHIEEVSTKTDEAYEKAYQAMPKYTVCYSLDGASTKTTADIANFDTSLPAGTRVSVLMQNANTVCTSLVPPPDDSYIYPKLSVSNTPAYPILTASGEYFTEANLAQVSWPQNSVVTFVFDGAHWRIDDSAALTKIDHIMTEDLWSSNGQSFINLNDGVFNYGQGAFAWDGSQLHITGDVDASGTLHGASLDGNAIDISAEGEITFDEGATAEEKERTTFHTFVQTVNQSATLDSGAEMHYKGVRIQSYLYDDTRDMYKERIWVDVDPYKGVQIWRPSGSAPSLFPSLRLGGANPEEGYDMSVIGEITGDAGGGSHADISIPNETWTDVITQTFLPGLYIVKATVRFAKKAGGTRRIRLNDGGGTFVWHYMISPAISEDYTYVNLVSFLSVSSTTTYYVQAWQNSGAAINGKPRFGAACIKRYWTPDILTGGSGGLG